MPTEPTLALRKAQLVARLARLVSAHEQLCDQMLLVRGQATEVQFMLDTLFAVTGNGAGSPAEENAAMDTGLEE